MRARTVNSTLKGSLSGCLLGFVICFAGCDTGVPLSEQQGSVVEDPRTQQFPPILTGVDTGGSQGQPVCPGDVITLRGINFSSELEENAIFFTAGNRRVKGLPLQVLLEATDEFNMSATLDVVVPGGVSRGNLELVVRGQSAGAAGLDVCPMIVGFTMGLAEGDGVLLYNIPGNPPGFLDGASRVTIYGLSFTDVQEALVSDDTGNTRRVASNSFVRNPTIPNQQGLEPTGLDSIAFNLRDGANDVRFPFQGERSNLGLVLRSSRSESNRLEAPVTVGDPFVDEIGMVITSVKVPVGVVTGPVRIHYTCYERKVDAEWTMLVDFKASNELFESDWIRAKPTVTDPELPGFDRENDGNAQILAGSWRHRSGHRLLPGIGTMRTFVWDAPNDPVFRAINNDADDTGLSRPRYWKIEFRITPVPDTENRTFYTKTHRAVTPPIVYFDLLDRPSGSIRNAREAEFVELFEDRVLEDGRATDAFWGPPFNPGLLTGNSQADGVPRFGVGAAVMVLSNIDPLNVLDPGEIILDEFITFDTDRMEVVHHVFTDAGTPADDADDVELAFIEPFVSSKGFAVLNPGEESHEFHLAMLVIKPDTRVIGFGVDPLVIRISSLVEDPQDYCDENGAFYDQLLCDLVSSNTYFYNAGLIDLNGLNGGDTPGGCPLPPNCGMQNGRGGRGGSGGGRGGDGGTVTIFTTTPVVSSLTDAEQGLNDGGGGGATPTALNFDPQGSLSIYHGEPGGGGGLATPGTDGDYGRTNVAQYQDPKRGRGGIVRGDPAQLVLVAGSGGGGGGGSVSRSSGCNGPYYTTAGGGGGGGGGALRVVATGQIVVEGQITSNGGNGGSGRTPHYHGLPPCDYPHRSAQIATGGAGAGGSGGTIFLQATGPISIPECASLEVNGGVGGESDRGGNQVGGDGGLGYIRLESAGEPLPFCGGIAVDPQVISDSGLTSSPDDVTFGRGQDAALHLSFIVSLDPITGDPVIDAETGLPTSIWTYDTGVGILVNPIGEEFRPRQPDVLDLNRFLVEENVVLRISGPRALTISVRDVADIQGTIDCSGFPGGPVRFTTGGSIPLPGLGGEPGPGGGPGGLGGTIRHVDGDADNRDPANTIPVPGEHGGAPPGLEEFDLNNPVGSPDAPDLLVLRFFSTATPGNSLRGRSFGACDSACRIAIDNGSAGGGAGGGNIEIGMDGQVIQPSGEDPALGNALIGRGGTSVGTDNLRLGGIQFIGGSGGSGGGASADWSSAYNSRTSIPGRYPFKGRAFFAVGTGGGGAGGMLLLKARTLRLRGTARILARGGDAYQSIDLGGNGGGGAGGSILIQVTHNLVIDPLVGRPCDDGLDNDQDLLTDAEDPDCQLLGVEGTMIDVRGGIANRLPPITLEGLRAYEGNVRPAFIGELPTEILSLGEAFGGLGGNGARGRVRLESPEGSPLISQGFNRQLTTGTFLTDSVLNLEFSGHPHNNRPDSGWRDAFRRLGLEMRHSASQRIFVLFRQATYVLE